MKQKFNNKLAPMAYVPIENLQANKPQCRPLYVSAHTREYNEI